jgi:hypothetical protein
MSEMGGVPVNRLAANGPTAKQIQRKATPLLAQLASPHGKVVKESNIFKIVTAPGASEKADGNTQRQWCVSGIAFDQAGAEVRYDADTGELIYAGTVGYRDNTNNTDNRVQKPLLAAREAVQVARAWMPKLGLTQSGIVSPVLFAPEKTPRGLWRVWLQGTETPAGPPLTVQLTVIAATGDLLYAAVVERSKCPSIYLPDSLGPPAAERVPLLF